MDISTLTDAQKSNLIENRWNSSNSVWEIVKKAYESNLRVYRNHPDWIDGNNFAVKKKAKIRANRIFRDVESVINSLIANLPQPNFIPTRDTPESKELAQMEQKFFIKKYTDLNVKEQMRKGLRNLYFCRLIMIKPFWNKKTNDFDAISIDPRNVRVNKKSTKEENSDFCIEEISDNLTSVMALFPDKATEIMKQSGYLTLEDAYINNPEIKYKEAWIGNYVMWKYGGMILASMKNPYWDWDGLLVTPEEERELKDLGGEQRRNALSTIRQYQAQRAQSPTEGGAPQQPQPVASGDGPADQSINGGSQNTGDPQTDLRAYYFNHFDEPRKPYIFATAFNNENTPVGQTDMIAQATPLQEGIDRRKQDIDENASLVNGQIKVDSSVMSKADAQKLRYEARGVIWGKGVGAGVSRETGQPLPAFVYEDMVDSRNEIDVIMAASSAFRGEREGQETKAGRLALVDQSYQNLNELVQIVDYVSQELFNWFYQLAKTRYTEHHYAKFMGPDNAVKTLSLMQDDMEDGAEVKIIAGKTLPEDRQFRYEQAQTDVKEGIISPIDYLEIAGYENPQQKAKDAVMYKVSPLMAVGVTPEEMQKIPPPIPKSDLREQIAFDDLPAAAKVQWLARMGITVTEDQIINEGSPSPVAIAFKDLPPDGQIQAAAKAGITLNPQIVIGEKLQEQRQKAQQSALDARGAEAKALVKSPIQPNQ